MPSFTACRRVPSVTIVIESKSILVFPAALSDSQTRISANGNPQVSHLTHLTEKASSGPTVSVPLVKHSPFSLQRLSSKQLRSDHEAGGAAAELAVRRCSLGPSLATYRSSSWLLLRGEKEWMCLNIHLCRSTFIWTHGSGGPAAEDPRTDEWSSAGGCRMRDLYAQGDTPSPKLNTAGG